MARTHSLVIISVRPWLEMQGLSLGVDGSGLVRCMGKLQDKGKLVSFMYTSVGTWSMAFMLRQHVFS